MNQRLKRINELLKREISLLFQKDFVFGDALVTVNAVEITPDLKQAQVYLGVIGSEALKEKVLQEVTGKRGFIQGRVSKRVVLKHTPQLQFHVDDSVERGVNVLTLIDSIEIPEELPPLDEEDSRSTSS